MTKESVRLEIYKLMDGFLTEGDKPRSIDQLNQDRHLFVENLFSFIVSILPSSASMDVGHKFHLDGSVEEYQSGSKDWIEGWNEYRADLLAELK